MQKNLPIAYTDAIDSKQLDIDFTVVINGVDRSSYVIDYSFDRDRNFSIAQATVKLNNSGDVFSPNGTYEILQGQSVVITETLAGSDFPKFTGIVDQPTYNKNDQTINIICLDDVVKAKNTDIAKTYEAGGDAGGTKVDLFPIGGIRLKPNIIAGTDYLAQTWDFVSEDYTGVWDVTTHTWDESGWSGSTVSAISQFPPPSVHARASDENPYLPFSVPQFSINYQTGQIVFNNPINIINRWIYTSFSYYSVGMRVENIIIDVMQANDGYGNAIFSDSNFQDDYNNVTNYTTDTLTPNTVAVTIDGTTYQPSEIWYFSFNNLVTPINSQFNWDGSKYTEFTTTAGRTVIEINAEYGIAILDAPDVGGSVVCTKQDYEFWTMQSTFIKTPYVVFKDRDIKNRIRAIEILRDVLPPNYFIRTRGNGKIWGSYIYQNITADYDLELISSLNYVGDKEVYTRAVVYGKNESPENLMTGAVISKPSTYIGYVDDARLTTIKYYDGDTDTLWLKAVTPGIVVESVRDNPEHPRVYAGDFDSPNDMVAIGRSDLGVLTVDSDEIYIMKRSNGVAFGWKTRAQISLAKNRSISVFDAWGSPIASLYIADPSTDDDIIEEGGWIKYGNNDIPSGDFDKISTIDAYLYTDSSFSFEKKEPYFAISNPGMSVEEYTAIQVGSAFREVRRSSGFDANWHWDDANTWHMDISLGSTFGSFIQGHLIITFDSPKIIYNSKIIASSLGPGDNMDVTYYYKGTAVQHKKITSSRRTVVTKLIESVRADKLDIYMTLYDYGLFAGDDKFITITNTGSGGTGYPKIYELHTDYLATFWYDADVRFDKFRTDYLVDGLDGEQMQITFDTQPIGDIPLMIIDLQGLYQVDAIDITNGFYIDYVNRPNKKYDIGVTYTLEYTPDSGGSPVWYPVSTKSAYFSLSGGESISFDREDMDGYISARKFRLTINNVEEVGNADIWAVSINEIAIYKSLVITGEARLTTTEAEDSLTIDTDAEWQKSFAQLYDPDGFYSRLGDVLYKEIVIRDNLRTQEDCNKRAYYLLREYLKNHQKSAGDVVYAPHLEIGDTVAVPSNDAGGGTTNYMLEGIRRRASGQVNVTLGRYPQN